jgi:gluconate 5-dehydrogenase
MNDIFDLTGKVALVTGGTHGIGLAIGLVLGKAGAKVCVNDLNDTKLRECRENFKKEGLDVFTLRFDVTDEEDVDKGISLIEKNIGSVDILVNNAGIIKRIPILDMSIADYKQVIDVDLVAPLIISKRVVPRMIEKRYGKIINMCSMMSVYGRNTVSAYASAKGGLKLLTRNMTCEWAKYNIQINGIGPGYIATSQTAPP